MCFDFSVPEQEKQMPSCHDKFMLHASQSGMWDLCRVAGRTFGYTYRDTPPKKRGLKNLGKM